MARPLWIEHRRESIAFLAFEPRQGGEQDVDVGNGDTSSEHGRLSRQAIAMWVFWIGFAVSPRSRLRF